jgi:site-specific recombinase XerD
VIAADFPALLQAFFTDRLLRQRQASPHTVTAYRATFRLLLRFAAARLGRPPSSLMIADLDAVFLGDFLDHLERDRGNSARSRNARLAALHAFFRYVAITEPAHALHCQRVLAIPSKRFERGLVEFLTDEEIDALLDAPDASIWIGRRDRALLLVAVQTGLRVSELTGLRRQDVLLGAGAHLRCNGKGRKLRCTPLRRDVVNILDAWMRERPTAPDTPVFPSSRGGRLSGDAVERLVAKYTRAARTRCPSLACKQITPHTLRHTAAMQLLRRGVDRTVIALWLGHESIGSRALHPRASRLAATAPTTSCSRSWRASDYPALDACAGGLLPTTATAASTRRGIIRRSG